MYETVIVGGGLQGVFFAHSLVSRGYVDAQRLRIIDPNVHLAAVWKRRTERVGMRFLRSPSSHNLDPDYRSLRRFASEAGYSRTEHLRHPYARPSTTLFNAQLGKIVEFEDLEKLHIPGNVTDISRSRHGYNVHIATQAHCAEESRTVGTTAGTGTRRTTECLEARRVILAVGPGPLRRPQWSYAHGCNVSHLFAGTDMSASDSVYTDSHRQMAQKGAKIGVIGGGISAWQAAFRYRKLGASSVHLLSPHPVAVSFFDSDPCYIGPKCGNVFQSSSIEQRLEHLREARYPGTLPPELAEAAREACANEHIHVTRGCADSVTVDGETITVYTRNGQTFGTFDDVVCATGFECDVPHKELLLKISETLRLPLHPSGHPVLDDALQWSAGLHCCGRQGELVIGPQAGSIVGAHLAFRRLIQSLRSRCETATDSRTRSECD